MTVKDAGAVRLVSTLSLAGLVAGLVLVGVYLWTKPAIERNRAEALERAILTVVPGSTGFRTMRREGDSLVAVEGKPDEDAEIVYAALDDQDQLVGYAIPGAGPGFMDTIGLIYGFDPEREVIVGLEILESRETPGLGDKIAYDPAWMRNFEALEVEPEIVGVKADPGANEVDTIAGATISSDAVVAIMNETIDRWKPVLTSSPAVALGGES